MRSMGHTARRVSGPLLALLAMTLSAPVMAQGPGPSGYPNKPVRILVPYVQCLILSTFSQHDARPRHLVR